MSKIQFVDLQNLLQVENLRSEQDYSDRSNLYTEFGFVITEICMLVVGDAEKKVWPKYMNCKSKNLIDTLAAINPVVQYEDECNH